MGRATLESDDDSRAAAAPTMPTITVTPPPLDVDDFDGRYALRTLLGRGGMGEVFLAKDRRIGREVALKATRSDGSEEITQRFSRECRLQGQLEHPGLVPVYDVGRMPDGAPFFTMKRVRGVTLEDVLRGLAKDDRAMKTRFSRARLLSIFATICQTVHFAHRRGVIHRDLKPANVMLGDFGEIYVLDWGVAKVIASDGDEDPPPSSDRAVDSVPPDDMATSHGALLGTLGYMAPEQLRNAAGVDARADVYALGTILCEMLTGERMHPAERAVDLAETTMGSCAKRIRELGADRGVPLELVELTVRATEPNRVDRIASAEDLVRAVERYLDGDRDLEARAKLAESEARGAAVALENLQSDAVELPAANAARAKALRRAGRALALDPSQPIAQDIVLRMMVWSPPRSDLPEEVARATEQRFLHVFKRGALAGTLLYAAWFPLVLFLLFTKPKAYEPLVTWFVTLVVAVLTQFANARAQRRSARLYFLALVASLTACFASSRLVGPYLMVPGVVTLTVMVFVLLGKPSWHVATALIGFVFLIAPAVFESTGVLPATTTFDANGMHVRSIAVDLDPAVANSGLAIGMGIILTVLCVAARFVQRLVVENSRNAALEAWKLSSLVPRATSERAPPSSRL
jgi:eukaryotic-like serine/threonine-protein kinase